MKKLLTLPFLLLSISSLAQTSVGIETQAYPAGIIPGIRFDVEITQNLNLNSRVGYNFTDRRDWGKHDNEQGGGVGFGLGIERTGFHTKNLSLNLRTDLWLLDIDWRNSELYCNVIGSFGPCTELISTGKSKVTILQPTIGLAYTLPVSDRFFLKPSLSFGYEINVKTDGEEVGEGAILLVGVQLVVY
ncbi:MAG: hypothetical protein BalsKO_00050 [Balneolaceae bacterium]